MADLGVLLSSVAVLFAVLYFYIKYKHGYWARLGVKNEKPHLIFGNLTDLFTMKKTIHEIINDMYSKFPNEKVSGFYGLTTPMLLIRDLDIIKDICIKDFDAFVNRSFHPDKTAEPLGSELMFGKWDDDWRGTRRKSAFAFTSGRIKKMYPLFTKAGNDINKLYRDTADKGEINIRNFSSRYGTDLITSCAFGSEGGAIRNPSQSIMYKILNDILKFNFKEGVSSNLMFLQYRSIYVFLTRLGLGFQVFRKQVQRDILHIVDAATKERLQSGERRGDIFDAIVFSDAPEFQGLQKKAGVAFQMLLGGSETISTTLIFIIYELAKNPEIQRKLQKEIRDSLKNHNGEMPYEELHNLQYLDQVFKETLRLFPVLPFLDRIAGRDYHLRGTDITIKKGTAVYIPLWAITTDPNFFPDPEVFNPERFSKENKQSFPEMAYIPFGAGPRHCIGERFGILGVKNFLVHCLKDFDVSLTEQAKQPLKWNKGSFTLTLEDGLPLLFSPTKLVD